MTQPRVTLNDINECILHEHYFTADEGVRSSGCTDVSDRLCLLTFCVLVLKNGFTVTGESACVSAENFNAAIGKQVARENAINKMWPLLGYELQSKLHLAP